MRYKSILKSLLLFGLAIIMSVSMFACRDDSQTNEKGELPNQFENNRYYFQQGYRTDWKIKDVNAEGYLLNMDTCEVLQMTPVEVLEKDDDGNPTQTGAIIEGVEYTIYAYKLNEHQNDEQKIYMTSTPSEVISWLMTEDNAFYFNNKFYVGAPRETYMQRPDVENYTAKYSKLQFLQVSYTFTRDGEDWRGIYSFVMKGQDFFIITYEAKSDLFDTYMSQYLESIGDFRKLGWETSDI